MVREAEQYKADDDKQRKRVQAKNHLESYAISMKSTMEEDKVKDKIPKEERQAAISKCQEIIDWLDDNETAEKQEFDHRHKQLEKLYTPIAQKLYQASSVPAPDGTGASSSGANSDSGSRNEQCKVDEHTRAEQQGRQKINIQAKKDLEKIACELKLSLEKAVCACNEVIDWVGSNESASKEEYDGQHKVLEEACKPVLDKLGHFIEHRRTL